MKKSQQIENLKHHQHLNGSPKLDNFIDLIQRLECPDGHDEHISFGKCEMQSGACHIIVRCSQCEARITNSGIFITKKIIPDWILDRLPIFESYLDYDNTCEVCDSAGVELHHWASKQFFPDDFEKWPKSNLCPKCHQLWHKTITIPLTRLQECQR